MWGAFLQFCTVVGGLAAIVAFVRWSRNQFREAQQAAEETLRDEVERLEASSGTLGSRTDLGFNVLLQIHSLTTVLQLALFFTVASLLCYFGVLLLGMGVTLSPPESKFRSLFWNSGDAAVFDICIIFSCYFATLAVFGLYQSTRRHAYLRRYQRRVRGIWQEHIERHAKRQSGKAKDAAD